MAMEEARFPLIDNLHYSSRRAGPGSRSLIGLLSHGSGHSLADRSGGICGDSGGILTNLQSLQSRNIRETCGVSEARESGDLNIESYCPPLASQTADTYLGLAKAAFTVNVKGSRKRVGQSDDFKNL